LAACFAALFLCWAAPAGAQERTDQAMTVSRAATAVERLRGDSNLLARLQGPLQRAKAVLIVPSLVKGGFIIGGEWGNGVLLVRRSDGAWSYPGFYTVISGSVGFQLGVQDSEVVLVILTEKGLSAVMNNAFKLGAELNVAFATAGAGAEASTTTALGADIIAFSKNVGLFGGGALEGTVIKPRASWNAAYYGGPATADDIVLRGLKTNPQADRLRDVLSR
jgi:lipid-binding SYLF domain-containing protein